MRGTLVLVGLLVLLPATVSAQQDATSHARPADVETLDGIIAAYYEVVSGPAGERPDRARDETLHVPGARVGIADVGPDGKPTLAMMTLGEFHDRFGDVREEPFHEWEIHRVTQRFGNITHVWSTYMSSPAPNGPPQSRGINSIHLYFDGARWWITGWIFDGERPGNPIPEEFLPSERLLP